MKWLELPSLYELAKEKRKKLLAIDFNVVRTCICEVNVVTSKVSLMTEYKRPKEFSFLNLERDLNLDDADVDRASLYDCLRSLATEAKAIGFIIGHHAPGVDDAPSSAFDSEDSKGYSARNLIRELKRSLHVFGYMPPKEHWFTLVNDRDAAKKGWSLVKDMYKDEDIDLDALDKDAFAAVRFGQEFLEQASSPFETSENRHFGIVAFRSGWGHGYYRTSDDSDNNSGDTDASDSSEE